MAIRRELTAGGKPRLTFDSGDEQVDPGSLSSCAEAEWPGRGLLPASFGVGKELCERRRGGGRRLDPARLAPALDLFAVEQAKLILGEAPAGPRQCRVERAQVLVGRDEHERARR